MKKETFNRLIQLSCYMLFSLFFILGEILWEKFKLLNYAKVSWLLMSFCFIMLGIYIIVKGIYLNSHWYSKRGRLFYGLLHIFGGGYIGYRLILTF